MEITRMQSLLLAATTVVVFSLYSWGIFEVLGDSPTAATIVAVAFGLALGLFHANRSYPAKLETADQVQIVFLVTQLLAILILGTLAVLNQGKTPLI